MPQINSEILDVYEITSGLNTIKSGIRLNPTELKNCQNIRYSPVGGFKWRQGYTTLGNQTNAACTGLYMARYSGGTNVAIRIQGAVIEKMDNLDGTWDTITGAVTVTSGQDNLCTFDMLNDYAVVSNNTDSTFAVDSSLTSAALTSVPFTSSLFNVQHRGYMFYGQPVVTATRQYDRIYFSDINNPNTVQTNNFIDVAKKNSGDLRGAVDYNGKLYLFKRHGIYAVEFQPTRVNTAGDLFPFIENPDPVVPGVGTQSHRSIVKFTTPSTHKSPGQEIVFFVDQFGVPRLFDGQMSMAIGAPITESRADNIVSLANMNKTRLAQVWAVNDPANNLIYCFMSSTGQTKHDVCWVLDYTMSFAWSRDSYADTFNCGAIFENTLGKFTPYFANYNGQVMSMNAAQTDNTTLIYSYARGGDFYVKSPVVRSSWLYNELRGTTGSETQTVTVEYFKDGEDTPSVSDSIILFKQGQAQWDVVTWDQFNWVYSGLTTQSSEINIEAKTLSVQFSNAVSSNTCSIEGYSLFVRPEGWHQED